MGVPRRGLPRKEREAAADRLGIESLLSMANGEGIPADAGAAAREAVDAASDKQASAVALLDVRGVSAFTDYMVVLTAGSVRQLNALAGDLTQTVEAAGLRVNHREGTAESGWVLLDFGDVVIHLFSEEQRAFYRLEQVWREGKELVRIQ